jgi:polysaccharide export outer membrane protein
MHESNGETPYRYACSGWSFVVQKHKLAAEEIQMITASRIGMVEEFVMIDKFAFLSFATWKRLLTCAATSLTLGTIIAGAQEQSPVSGVPTASAPVTSVTEDTRYRIGPGDVLTILVRKAPELSGPVRVDQRGMIRIPMIPGEIRAACRTEGELAAEITRLYLEYKNNPNVEVFVTEFQSRPVAIIGAVRSPGQFRLQRQVRLLELISLAGGPTERAGRTINLVHAGGPSICEKDADVGANAEDQTLSMFKLNDTFEGRDGANPVLRPGDIISLPEADQVFVVGYVYSPRPIPLKDKPITVSGAIAMAGGPQPQASTSKVRIIRQGADGVSKQEIPVDLKAILKLRAPDITLVPNDIVEVGSSTSKMLLNMLTGALPALATQGVVRAIP